MAESQILKNAHELRWDLDGKTKRKAGRRRKRGCRSRIRKEEVAH
jgi:hypothetical protein